MVVLNIFFLRCMSFSHSLIIYASFHIVYAEEKKTLNFSESRNISIQLKFVFDEQSFVVLEIKVYSSWTESSWSEKEKKWNQLEKVKDEKKRKILSLLNKSPSPRWSWANSYPRVKLSSKGSRVNKWEICWKVLESLVFPLSHFFPLVAFDTCENSSYLLRKLWNV